MKYVVCKVWLLLLTLFVLSSWKLSDRNFETAPTQYHKHLTRGLTTALEFPREWQTSCLTHLSLCRSTNGPSISDWKAVVSVSSPSSTWARRCWLSEKEDGLSQAFQISSHIKLRTGLTVHVVHIFLDPRKCWKFKMRASKPAVQFRRSAVSNSLWPHGLQHTKPIPSCSCPPLWIFHVHSPIRCNNSSIQGGYEVKIGDTEVYIALPKKKR